MNQKTTVACITAALAAFAGACQGGRGTEPGERDQTQEPQIIAPETERPEAERREGVMPGDGQEGRRDEGAMPGDGQEGRRLEGDQAGAMKLSDLMDNPENRIGQNVTVRGKVDEVYGERGLKLTENGESVFVLGRSQVRALDAQWDDAKVRVTGTLRRMTSTDDIQREIGWNLDTRLTEEIGDENFVLIADDIQRVEGKEHKE
jgi:hypothetical protein